MKLHITFVVLWMVGCLIHLIVIDDFIRTSSFWMALSAADGSDLKDGSHWARWIIWGVILTFSLSLSPNQAQGVFPKSTRNQSDLTPMQELAATPQVTTTEAACLKSSAIPETASFKEIPIGRWSITYVGPRITDCFGSIFPFHFFNIMNITPVCNFNH
jgi:hypothetical protein